MARCTNPRRIKLMKRNLISPAFSETTVKFASSNGMPVDGEESATNMERGKEDEKPPGFKSIPHELPLPRLRHISPHTYGSPSIPPNPGSGIVGEYIPKQSVLPLLNFLPSLLSLLDSPSRRSHGHRKTGSNSAPNIFRTWIPIYLHLLKIMAEMRMNVHLSG